MAEIDDACTDVGIDADVALEICVAPERCLQDPNQRVGESLRISRMSIEVSPYIRPIEGLVLREHSRYGDGLGPEIRLLHSHIMHMLRCNPYCVA